MNSNILRLPLQEANDEGRYQTQSERNEVLADFIGGELHRLHLPLYGGWVYRPDLDDIQDGTRILLMGRRTERPYALIPLQSITKLVGRDWKKQYPYHINVGGFTSPRLMKLAIDVKEVVPLTYFGKLIGAVMFADVLLARLQQRQK